MTSRRGAMHTPTTFWEHVEALRRQKLIARTWRIGHLIEHLEGSFKATTINVLPYNSSISRAGEGLGDYVKRGVAPRAWRVGRGQFQLIADPEDDAPTRAAERKHALRRAEDLRSRRRQSGGRRDETTVSLPARYSPRTESASPSDLYPSIPVTLTDAERDALEGLTTEQKALRIVNKHLIETYGSQVAIEADGGGADLRITANGESQRIEVKGTESPTIAWQQLKVSSQQSHDVLESGEASIYRVVDVGGAHPRIYVLKHGEHFVLEPELRWAVKRIPPQDDRYPLRGEPYRYDRPYDSVAASEWEIQG